MQLVERVGRGVRFTAAGKVLAEHSERVFEALDEPPPRCARSRRAEGGCASRPSRCRLGLLPPVMARLRERFPDLRLEVEDLEGEQSLEAIRLGHTESP